MALSDGTILQQQKKSIEKSYLDKFYSSKNVRNRSSVLELLFVVLKNTFELLLSSEIDQFVVDDFLLFSNEIHTVGTKGNVTISREILENRPPQIVYLGAHTW